MNMIPTPFITNRIEPDDILFGRGTGPNANIGNKVFRKVILKHAPDYTNALTCDDRRLIVRRAMAAINQTKARFLRRLNSKSSNKKNGSAKSQSSAAIRKQKAKPASYAGHDDDDGLFEVITDPEVIYQKVKLALRYAGGNGAMIEGGKQQQALVVEEKFSVVATANDHKSNEESGMMTSSTEDTVVSPSIRPKAVLEKEQQQHCIVAGQPKPGPMPMPPYRLASPSCQHGGGVSRPALLLPSFAAGMSIATSPPPSSLFNSNNNSRTLQELVAMALGDHHRFPERRRFPEEQSAMAALLAQRALQQLQARRMALLESLIYDGHHDMVYRGLSHGK